MKKLSIIVALFALIIAGGCTKKYYYGDDVTQNPPFLIQGIQDISVNANSPQRNFYVSCVYNHGEQEKVKLSFEGLPAGAYGTFYSSSFGGGGSTPTPTYSGIPSFEAYATIYDSSAAPGVYEVNIVAVGTVSGKRKLPFTLTVTSVPDCRDFLSGTYNTSNFCAIGPSTFTSSIRTDASVAKKIYFDNFEKFRQYALWHCQLCQSANYDPYTGNQRRYLFWFRLLLPRRGWSCGPGSDKLYQNTFFWRL